MRQHNICRTERGAEFYSTRFTQAIIIPCGCGPMRVMEILKIFCIVLECHQIEGQQFTSCANRCELTCDHYLAQKYPSRFNEVQRIPIFCMASCPSPRCICEEGRYRQGFYCVLPKECES